MKLMSTLVVAAVVALVAIAAAFSMTPPRANGTVGPGFTISLKKAGVLARTLKRGRTAFVVADKSSIHNFHLKGPVSRVITGIGFTGTKTVTLLLKRGTYTYVCDVHPSMIGHFKVL
jgi:plastocyanin